MPENPTEYQAAGWLVLLYQFPKGPDARRVKVWRRLQNIGAVAIKNSVYVLPRNEQTLEDFQWLLTELQAGGAEAAILEARFVDGMSDEELKAQFNEARNEDYRSLAEDIRAAIEQVAKTVAAKAAPTSKFRREFAEIEAIDWFGAEEHDKAEEALRRLALAVTPDEESRGDDTMPATELQDLNKRTWVTRRGVRVDRIASAWLIRRWIDPDARFKFVPGKAYEPKAKEIRFDMFEAEFTHQGDACTFEVLAKLARPDDSALVSVAEIVHDIDLKDSKFGRAETDGVAGMLAGLFASTDDDEERIKRGGALFEDLYRFFESRA